MTNQATPDIRLLEGDALVVLAGLPDASIDACITDPPYGLRFMGRAWDHGVPDVPYWSDVLRVLKPGGHLLAFGGTRTFHRLTCAIEDAGFEIRDCLMWLYGQGFPKSRNLDGDRRGWGTALKPAWEPIILARKPLAGAVAANVLAHGTGALNIDGCRIGNDTSRGERYNGKPPGGGTGKFLIGNADGEPGVNKPWAVPAGRWPANVVLDESAAALLDEQGGVSKSSATPRNRTPRVDTTQRRNGGGRDNETAEYSDRGGASRFFYTAKASPSERGAYNDHPTVKPLALMRWLVRLVAPPGGTLIDPFMGSGSTLIAANHEGFDAIGIDSDPHAVEIARRRLADRSP